MYAMSVLDLDEGKAGQGRTGRLIECLTHDPDMVKDLLADLIARGPSRDWRIPLGYSARPKYIAEMTAERSVANRWVNPQSRPNHAWDAECLALVGAVRLGYYVLTDAPPQTEPDADATDQEADNAER
jgi:hypothetical protein